MKSFINPYSLYTLISLSFIFSINKSNAYLLMPDVDFYGGDMYPVYNVNSTINCLILCESVRNCRLATWCDSVCYLKDIKTNQSEKINCITIDMYPEEQEEGSAQIDNQTITVAPVTTMPTPTTITPEPTTATTSDIITENSEETDTPEPTSGAYIIKNISITAVIVLSAIILF